MSCCSWGGAITRRASIAHGASSEIGVTRENANLEQRKSKKISGHPLRSAARGMPIEQMSGPYK